ncbi:MAG TPA: pimeloyl-[acyl-carrier protein] methyl ester esterase [Gammaproteobacteria bacterium]|nr:pimeloyl-[acyl-carrier protein] methyl ester esterase [Gammaproteobacteria bacterium]
MNLFTQTLGDGADVVLLHGWGMNADVWEGILPTLTKQFRVTLLDLPGHGRSLDSLADYSLKNLAATIDAFIPQNAMLIGWSLGGMIATQLTLNKPDNIRKLVLVASAPQFVRDDTWPDGTEAEVLDSFADGLKQNYQQTIKRFIAIQAMGSEHAREQQHILRERVFRHGNPQPAALEAGLAILRHTNLRPGLAKIACPTLLISGEHDALFRRSAAEKTQAMMADARLSVIPGAGHAPFLSHPDAFLQTLVPFLS